MAGCSGSIVEYGYAAWGSAVPIEHPPLRKPVVRLRPEDLVSGRRGTIVAMTVWRSPWRARPSPRAASASATSARQTASAWPLKRRRACAGSRRSTFRSRSSPGTISWRRPRRRCCRPKRRSVFASGTPGTPRSVSPRSTTTPARPTPPAPPRPRRSTTRAPSRSPSSTTARHWTIGGTSRCSCTSTRTPSRTPASISTRSSASTPPTPIARWPLARWSKGTPPIPRTSPPPASSA